MTHYRPSPEAAPQYCQYPNCECPNAPKVCDRGLFRENKAGEERFLKALMGEEAAPLGERKAVPQEPLAKSASASAFVNATDKAGEKGITPAGTAPAAGAGELVERLREAMSRVGKMCSEGRPPKMRIPATPDDDDLFICNTIREAIAALSRQRGWIPASERLPEESDDVIAVSHLGIRSVQAGLRVARMAAQAKIDGEDCYYTHWMPLAAAPNPDEEANG